MSTTILKDAEIFGIFDTCSDLPLHYEPDEIYAMGRAIEQAVLQSPEIQALRKDAERYRFLRDEAETSPRDVFGTHWLVGLPEPVSLDSAIDAALEDQP